MTKEILVSNRQGSGPAHEVRVGGDGQQIGGWLGGQSSSGVSDSVGASYKSVLLCDRPAQSTAGIERLKTTNADHAFVSSVKPREPLGLPPARDTQLGAIIYEYKKPTLTVNVQHRKWLRALSRLKAKMQQDQAEAEEQAQVRKSRFRKRLARLRQAVRSRNAVSDTEDAVVPGDEAAPDHHGASELDVSLSPRLSAALETGAPVPETGAAIAAAKPTATRKQPAQPRRKGRSKPLWAMTETEANVHETAEADELLDFAASLDYDRYISDLEVQTTLRALLNRVYELERGEAAATTTENAAPVASGSAPAPAAGEDLPAFDDGASVASAVLKGAQLDTGRWKGRFLSAWGELREDQRAVLRRHFQSDDASVLSQREAGWDATTGPQAKSALAKKILEGSETMRSIHSEASVRQILEKMQGKAPNV